MWWQVFANMAVEGDAAKITWIRGVGVLGNAAPAIAGLFLKMAGRDSVWRVDATNSTGRLIFIKETDGSVNISIPTNREGKSIEDLLESWKGQIGARAGTLKENRDFRLDLQSHTSGELFVNLQIQKNQSRSGSKGKNTGGGSSNTSSTTMAQIFIPTKVMDQVTRDDIIAAFKVSMKEKKAVALMPKV